MSAASGGSAREGVGEAGVECIGAVVVAGVVAVVAVVAGAGGPGREEEGA